MAMFLRRVNRKVFLPGCVKQTKPSSVSRDHVSHQCLSLSDVRNPSSPISLNDFLSSHVGSNLHIFTRQELEGMTNNLSRTEILGEGGFGKVYKGFIDDKLKPGLEAQPVAVKVLDQNGSQGHREWLTEVIMLGRLKHPHLVKLIGYCSEDEHRALVYEYLALGDLEDKLFNNSSAPLPWLKRIKIAIGAAKCLAYLHEEEKPVIHRDLKASNILLDTDYIPKLSDFGLAKDGPQGDDSQIATRVMGTPGYVAPEYMKTGKLTTMCDVFSFGVVLLELLTGRRSVDNNRSRREQDLVEWARPFLKDLRKLEQVMDPKLEGRYSTEGVKKAAALAYKCLSHQPKSRPTMRTVVKKLEPLLDLKYIPIGPFVCNVSPGGNISCVYKNFEEVEPELKTVNKAETKEDKKEENGHQWHRKGRRQLRRISPTSSRAVYSDTALYKTLGTSLYSPMN